MIWSSINKHAKLAKNFSRWECCQSEEYPLLAEDLWKTVGGYDELISLLAILGLQPLRDHLNEGRGADRPEKTLSVINWYRDSYLNSVVGGSIESLHLKGLAADVTTQRKEDLFELYKYAKENMQHIFCEIVLYTDDHNNPISMHLGFVQPYREQIIKKSVHRKYEKTK